LTANRKITAIAAAYRPVGAGHPLKPRARLAADDCHLDSLPRDYSAPAPDGPSREL